MSKFTDMRHQIQGQSWLDDLARASLTAADAKFGDGGRVPYLSVEISGDLDARSLSVIADSVQRAVARMGKYLAGNTDAVQIRDGDVDVARLYPRRQFGRRVEFSFSNPAGSDEHLFFVPGAGSVAENASLELVELLPDDADDHEAVEFMLARDRGALGAVRDIISAVQQTAGIGMTVTTHIGNRIESTVTVDQARELGDRLRESNEYERSTITVEGRIDGMRTRRRIFYLETASTGYEGVFDAELVNAVKTHIDKSVVAIIERVRPLRLTGPRGRWSYRLTGISESGTDVP